MSNAKHTPGPWSVGWNIEANLYQIDAPDGDSGDTAPIADVWAHNALESECKANAALIAAAPDLLEALNAVMDSYQRGQMAIEHKVFNKMRVAIARAEGKE
jgi:hypothetical protein